MLHPLCGHGARRRCRKELWMSISDNLLCTLGTGTANLPCSQHCQASVLRLRNVDGTPFTITARVHYSEQPSFSSVHICGCPCFHDVFGPRRSFKPMFAQPPYFTRCEGCGFEIQANESILVSQTVSQSSTMNYIYPARQCASLLKALLYHTGRCMTILDTPAIKKCLLCWITRVEQSKLYGYTISGYSSMIDDGPAGAFGGKTATTGMVFWPVRWRSNICMCKSSRRSSSDVSVLMIGG